MRNILDSNEHTVVPIGEPIKQASPSRRSQKERDSNHPSKRISLWLSGVPSSPQAPLRHPTPCNSCYVCIFNLLNHFPYSTVLYCMGVTVHREHDDWLHSTAQKAICWSTEMNTVTCPFSLQRRGALQGWRLMIWLMRRNHLFIISQKKKTNRCFLIKRKPVLLYLEGHRICVFSNGYRMILYFGLDHYIALRLKIFISYYFILVSRLRKKDVEFMGSVPHAIRIRNTFVKIYVFLHAN